MKRKLSILLAALLVLSVALAGCGSKADEDEETAPEGDIVLTEDEDKTTPDEDGTDVDDDEDGQDETPEPPAEAPPANTGNNSNSNGGNNSSSGGNTNSGNGGSTGGNNAGTTPPPAPAAPAESISGSAKDVLTTLLSNSGADFGMTFEDSVTADSAQGNLGLSSADFNSYVTEAYVSTGAITTNAHLVAIIKCKDADAAAQVKSLVASGFDSNRWICVAPEQSFVVEGGSYVLLAATANDGAQALKTAFASMAGSGAGSVNQFFNGRA